MTGARRSWQSAAIAAWLAIPLAAPSTAAAQAPAGSEQVYATAALRALVRAAADSNRAVPPTLGGYRAHVETEVGFVIRDTLGRQHTTQVEQIASGARWTRDGRYDLHVVGYRMQSMGGLFSALGLMRSWTVPTLYGDRLDFGVEPRRGPAARRTDSATVARGDTIHAVHPLAADRDEYYRFEGGDTVATLRTAADATPIVRVRVIPRPRPGLRLALFEGEIQLDAVRHVLVRMRGRIDVVGPPPKKRPLVSRLPGLVAAAYVELENARVGGRYWLPAYQRTELQAGWSVFGEDRSVFRIVSRFADYAVEERPTGDAVASGDTAAPVTPAASDSERTDSAARRRPRRTVTLAGGDSLSRYGAWQRELGATTAAVGTDDFDDVGPRQWRSIDSRPRTTFFPRRLDDVFRYDRVEGTYTGASAEWRRRDSTRSRTLRAYGGWAWAEHAVRGAATATEGWGPWSATARAERQLASTNDFEGALGGSWTFPALLFSVDDADYVDRRLATVALTRAFPSFLGGSMAQLEIGAGSDRREIARLTRGPIAAGDGFRPNRGSDDGDYARVVGLVEIAPSVSGVFLDQGLGARVRTEIGRGELSWQRIDVMLAARRRLGALGLAAHAMGGMVAGATIPAQTLFEVGGTDGLPGYAYKEFGGDRAALGRARASWDFPVLRRPWRVLGGYYVPGPSPGVLVGLSGGWAEASTASARAALARLGTTTVGGVPRPVSVPTGGARATVDLQLTFLGGALQTGIARPVDHAAPWRWVVSLGEAW